MSWLGWTLVGIASSGVYAIVCKKALGMMTWQQFMFWDMATYIVIVGVMFWLTKQDLVFGEPMGWAVLCCVIGFVGMMAANIAFQRGKVSLVAPMLAVYPAVTMALAVPLLGEALTVKKVIGMVLAVVAVSLLAEGSSG